MRSRSSWRDERADVRVVRRRIADHECFDAREEALEERVVRGSLDVDPLDRDAALTRERERVRGEARRDVVEIRIGGDDHRRGVPELEVDALAGGSLAKLPADAGGARERDQRDALVVDENVTDLGGRPDDDVQPSGGQAGLHLELGEKQRGQRRLRRRLQHHGAAGGERRRDLVRHEVEREVERRDRPDDPDRHAQRERDLAGACRRRVHRNDVAGELARLDRGHREGGHGARRLDSGSLHRLPGLGGDRPSDLLAVLVDQTGGAVEDRSTLVRRKRVGHGSRGGVDCAAAPPLRLPSRRGRRASRRTGRERPASCPFRPTRHRRGASARSRS